MGIRIDAYAVDASRLSELLWCSLDELLWRYYEDGTDADERLYWIDHDAKDATYMSIPREKVTGTRHGPDGARLHGIMTRSDTANIIFLQQAAFDHFSGGAPYPLAIFLRCFARCNGIDFIRPLTEGHRRWWIGSLLQGAKEGARISSLDCERLEFLFQKMLRGWDCGYPMTERRIDLEKFEFPALPEDDPDMRFSVWSQDETRFALAVLEELISLEPRFVRPPGRVAVTLDDDEWHSWVVENVRGFLRAASLKSEWKSIISLIA